MLEYIVQIDCGKFYRYRDLEKSRLRNTKISANFFLAVYFELQI